jgi:hypothetical protein
VAIQMQRSMTWNQIVAFSFLLMATGMSILFLWGLAISADLVFQALHGRPNPQMRLVISCAIGAGWEYSPLSRHDHIRNTDAQLPGFVLCSLDLSPPQLRSPCSIC